MIGGRGAEDAIDPEQAWRAIKLDDASSAMRERYIEAFLHGVYLLIAQHELNLPARDASP